MNDKENLHNRLYCSQKKNPIKPNLNKSRKKPIVPPLQLSFKIDTSKPPNTAHTERNPRLGRIPTCRGCREETLSTPSSARANTAVSQSWFLQASKDMEEWKKHQLYTPFISDMEWNDRNLPFWYIWQFNILDLKSEFIYLDYAKIPTPNMYCLVPVHSSVIDMSKYYTLSIDGITFYQDGHGKFLHINQWLREVILYRRIGHVPFFKNFFSIYAFRYLVNSAVSKKTTLSSSIIQKKFLISSPHFKIIKEEIRKIAIEIKTIPLIDLKFVRPLSLNEFLEKQSLYIQKLIEKIKTMHNRAKEAIVAACELAHSVSRDIGSQTDASYSIDHFIEQQQQQQRRQKSSRRIKRSLKEEQAMIDGDSQHYTRLATVRSCCKRITKFIRACDYQFMQSLLECVNNSAKQFTNFFLSHPQQMCLSINFEIDHFDPSPNFFISQMAKAWEELSSVTFLFERFLYSPTFHIYTKQSLNKLNKYREIELVQSFKDVLLMDSLYKDTMSQLEPNIQSVFTELSGITASLVPYIEIHNLSKSMKMEFSEDTSNFFNELISTLKHHIDKIDEMPEYLDHRVVQISLRRMKNIIAPSPRSAIDKLRVYLPKLCYDHAEKFDILITDLWGKLSADVNNVFSFGDQYELYLQLVQGIQSHRSQYHKILDLFNLLGNEGFPISGELENIVRSLNPKYSAFESTYAKISESKDQLIRKWTERIKKDVSQLSEDIVTQQTELNSLTDDVALSLNTLRTIDELGTKYQHDLERYNSIQALIGMKQTEIDGLQIFLTDLRNKKTLYQTADSWRKSRVTILNTFLKTIAAIDFQASIEKTKTTADFLVRTFPKSRLGSDLKESITEFYNLAPVISTLRSPALEDRHWERIEKMLPLKNLRSGDIKIQMLLDHSATKFTEEFAIISVEAENEQTLLKMIEDILIQWAGIKFDILTNADTNVLTLGGLANITEALDESLVKCSTIRGSRYVGPIKMRVDKTMSILNRVGKMIDLIGSVQKQWQYLRNIFKDSDIQRQLSNEFKQFYEVEKEFKSWVYNVRDKPRVYGIAAIGDEPIKMLHNWDKRYESIQKAIEAFLMSKRTEFPRFFFLSNDDLIEILSLGKNPVGLQRHLNKLFENIYGLHLIDNGHSIDAIVSKEGEKVNIPTVAIRGPVEGWLKSLETSMKKAIQLISTEAYYAFESKNFQDWAEYYPAQTILAITQCYFTHLINQDIHGQLDHALEQYESRLKELAGMVRKDVTELYREKIVSLITIEVHSRDIIEELMKGSINDPNDFEWMKRLRFYFEENKLYIRQHNANIEYGCEYLGVTSRLIITPLTERCYLTLTSALRHHLGGSPAGPAGTGKTETVKDLAKAIANFCVVFNCSEAVTASQMQSFFSGLSQTGAWSCFDEFNRIDPGVLSVIAEQVRTIQDALNSNAQTFVFCGKNIPLNPRCGVFITMNPGYAGRTELPDNLKALFRPIAMTVPDYALIALIFLYGQGFENARILAEKITQLYKLSSEMLSPQFHYDFGMRALKSVLSMAGLVKRQMPNSPEDEILIQAINNSNIPKLLGNDKILFQSLVNDLFQDVVFETIVDPSLTEKLSRVLLNQGLDIIPAQIVKTVQLHETMRIRHGVMLVGPTGGGKSVSLHSLGTVLNANMMTINPKSIDLSKMYGAFDPNTGEWFDGIVSKMFRESVASESKQQQWIIFDGPVDALWIENMNTVLDDNKMLSLANSQRLKMTDEMHMLFEVGDLSQASPATVSRCGMVYYETCDIPWKSFVHTWLSKSLIRTEYHESLIGIIEQLMVLLHGNSCYFTLANAFQTLKVFVESMLRDRNESLSNDIHEIYSKKMNCIFVWCFAWAFGGNLVSNHRAEFDNTIREVLGSKLPYPPKGTMFDYFLEKDCLTFSPWSDISTKIEPNDVFVETDDTVCYSQIIELCIKNRRHIMITGPSGSGKSSIILNALKKLEESTYSFSLTLSAQTSAKQIQETIESKMESKKKTLLGPPEGKGAVFLVDDIIMPKPDTYGSQPPLEILRQYLGFGGFYNTKDLSWIDVRDLTLIAAGQPPGGGRTSISPRLQSQFTLLHLNEPNEKSLKIIFNTILDLHFGNSKFLDPVKSLRNDLVTSSVVLFGKVCREFLPTPSRSHYTFNLRDLAHVFTGIKTGRHEVITSVETMVNLWEHENMRIYSDRLVDQNDRQTFIDMITMIKKNHFKIESEETIIKPIFCDFMTHDGYYRPYINFPKIRDKLYQLIDERLPSKKLVFFSDAIHHLCRLIRVLRQPSGNMMLVGVGGTGKRTTARVAAAIAECMYAEPKLTNHYTRVEFREDLKELYVKCGIEGKSIVFLLSDEHIINESFLEDVNCILNNGEVPNLFDSDETEKIVNEMTPVIKKLNLSFARDVILSTFINRVKSNLHIVLALSPIGNKFRTRTNMFPSLVNCCTIDWFDIWTNDALTDVALNQFKEIDFSIVPTVEGIYEKLAQAAMLSHSAVTKVSSQMLSEVKRLYYVTPAAYIDFMKAFGSLLGRRQKKLEEEQSLLKRGLLKLTETNSVVGSMEQELVALKPQLQEKAIIGQQLLENLERDKLVLEETKSVVEVEKVAVQKMADVAGVLASKAKSERDAILPMLKEATEAVEQLKSKKGELSAVKTYKNPPARVRLVMSAVCSLNKFPTDWKGAQAFLAKPNMLPILGDLHNYLVLDDVNKIQPFLQDPEFTVDLVAEQSAAASCLCRWVIAINNFIRVRTELEPLEKRLSEAQANLEEAESKLNLKQAELNQLEDKYNILRNKLHKSLEEQKELENKINRTQIRLDNASKLTTALNDEYERWSASLEDLNNLSANIVGDTLLIALNLSYIGPFPPIYRVSLLNQLRDIIRSVNIPFTEQFSLESASGDPMEIRDWRIAGLPSDTLSTENGILVTQSTRWPLLIDPQEQGFRWFCAINENTGLQIVRPGEAKLSFTLESAIKMGTPIIVEGVEETIDPALKSILNPQIRKGPAGNLKINLDGREIDYDPKFRLVLVTKHRNPVFLPDVFIQLSVINFAVTPEGLVEQLITDVVKLEKPDVEAARAKLVVEIAQNKKLLDQQMKKILNLLFKSEGNLLDNEELILALQNAKTTARQVSNRLEECEITERQNRELCDIYRGVANRGSILFFTLPDLPSVDPMYQYSLEFFKNLFISCILVPVPTDISIEKRLADLIDLITYRSYCSVSRGLFSRHQIFYSFLLISSIMRGEGVIPTDEWDLIVRGPSRLPDEEKVSPPDSSINSLTWRRIIALGDECPPLAKLHIDISQNFDDFKEFFISERSLNIPDRYNELTPFQRVLLISISCPRKFILAATEFIVVQYGQQFAQTPDLSISSAFSDTKPQIPLVFILSQGADPLPALRSYSEKCEAKLSPLSLGQGQGPIASQLIQNAKLDGGWVFLQNCHLYTVWLNVLSDILREIRNKPKDVHPSFRLFLSSMPTPDFPFSVLQESVKVTSEPPRGLSLNVSRLLTTVVNPSSFDQMTTTTQRFVIALAFFASLIQERKKFGPLGWNIIYEWSDSDYRISTLMISSLIREGGDIQWKAIISLVGHIAFGGRVTDDWDRRCLLSHLCDIISPKLIQDSFHFDCSNCFSSPPTRGYEAALRHIETYPTDDPPHIFGLHLNAQMSAQTTQSLEFLTALQSVQPRMTGGSSGSKSDSLVIDTANNIKTELPQDLIYREPEVESSLHVVLRQEIIRYNRLLRVIRSSVNDIVNAVKGLVIMNESLSEMYTAFTMGKVPSMWSSVSYPSLKPLVSWFADLLKRIEFIRNWNSKGEPIVYWIGGFFFPQSFMTGVLQNYSRKHKVPVNSLRFRTEILQQNLDTIRSPPDDGVYIYGMYFDGADWDPKEMIMKDPKVGTSYSPAPVIQLLPQPNYEMPKEDFSCPVYRTQVRAGVLSSTGISTNYVVSVHLPVKEAPTFWILRGAALLLSTPN